MNKRKLLIIVIVTIIVIALLIVGLTVGYSFHQIEIDKYGLRYNKVVGKISDTTVYNPGIYYFTINDEFIQITKTKQIINFKDLKCLTSDFVLVKLNLQIIYQINFIDQPSLSNYYINFGNNPSQILRPLFKNQIQNTFSRYTMNDLQNFNTTQFQLQAAQDLNKTIFPLVNLNINVLTQTISSNYKNKTISAYIALLQQKIIQLKQINSTIKNSTAEYAYRIGQMYQRLINQNTNRQTLQVNNLYNKLLFINNQVTNATTGANPSLISRLKLMDFLNSNNQSYYQDLLMPNNYRTGKY